MSQVQDVARQVLAEVASDASHVLASQWVADRYVEMVTKIKYRHLRKVGELVQPATITAGTVTVTEGSTVVTPDADALAAWQAVPQGDLIGRFLRTQDPTWYEIEQFNAGTITLKSPYAIPGGTGIGYNLAARYLTLDKDARWLGDFMHMRLWKPVTNTPLDALDYTEPARTLAQSVPAVYVDLGLTPDGRRLVEVYPYAAQTEIIHYVFWEFPKHLDFDDELPSVIPDYTLKEGALINAMRYAAGQAARLGQMEAAAYWRNEYRAQETRWKDWMRDAARADKGVDDLTFIVQGYGTRYGLPYIRTAHDQIYSQWWS